MRLAFDLAARHALEIWKVWAQCFERILAIKQGHHRAGLELLQSALERLAEQSSHHQMNLFLAELALGLGGAGQMADGLVVVARPLTRPEQTESAGHPPTLLPRTARFL